MERGNRVLFSLIELLVVISIIAILASLLLPTLNSAKEKGRSITCVNNLKQIGYILTSYCNDNKGFTPAFRTNNLKSDCGQYAPWFFHLALAGYIGKNISTRAEFFKAKQNRIFLCPSGKPSAYDENDTTTKASEMSSYGLNRSYKAPDNLSLGIWEESAIRLDRLSQPSRTILIADSLCGPTLKQYWWFASWNGDGTSSRISARHMRSAGILCADLHAETANSARLLSGFTIPACHYVNDNLNSKVGF